MLKYADDFNDAINRLISIMEKRTRNDLVMANLDRARKRLSALRMELGREEPIKLSHAFFIQYKSEITARNEAFFTNLDLRREYTARTGKHVSNEEDFVFELGTEAQRLYKLTATTQSIRDEVYDLISRMLNVCLSYRLAEIDRAIGTTQ